MGVLAAAKLTRKLIPTPRGEDGLFIQPKETGPARETIEMHNRERAFKHGKYADTECGDPNTFDVKGNYLCGDCNNVQGDKCVLVNLKSLKGLKAPSCGDYETKRAGDAEKWLKALSVNNSSFGNAENGEGFGCHRCPYQEKAHAPDSRGRNVYCKVWETRVMWNACCKVNGAPTTEIPKDWDVDSDPDDPWEGEE